jgi:hypothetical protein
MVSVTKKFTLKCIQTIHLSRCSKCLCLSVFVTLVTLLQSQLKLLVQCPATQCLFHMILTINNSYFTEQR